MGLLSFLDKWRNGVDATSDWVADLARQLEFCLDDASLCGVKLHDPIDGLHFLGPAEWCSKADSHRMTYFYYSKGLQFTAVDGEVSHLAFEFAWHDEYRRDDPFQEFSGTCTYQGKAIELTANSTIEKVIEMLGEPTEGRDDDQTQATLCYRFGGTGIEFDFVPDDQGRRVLYVILV